MTERDLLASTNPLELPIVVYSARCRLSRPTKLAGIPLQRKLRGAFHRALVDADPLLFRPAPGAGRHHGSPVLLRFPWDGPPEGSTLLAGELVLWGRRARTRADQLLAAVRGAGREGLTEGRQDTGPIVFQTELELHFDGTLGTWADASLPAGNGTLEVTLASPCDAEDADLAKLAGNAADALFRWDLEDRGEAEGLPPREIDAAADLARYAAASALSGVVVRAEIAPRACVGSVPPSRRRPGFELRGFTGRWIVEGPLAPIRPWLALLALHGAGQHLSYGMGQVWVEGLPTVAPTRQPEPIGLPPETSAGPSETRRELSSGASGTISAALLLVGDQRIPNVLPILDSPGLRTITLVHSQETRTAAAHLRSWLSAKGHAVSAHEVVDAHDYGTVRGVLEKAIREVSAGRLLVNVTGGTKVMSFAALDLARESGHVALYVDTQNGCIRELSPRLASEALKAQLTVSDFFVLHGQTWHPTTPPPSGWLESARAIGRTFDEAAPLIVKLRRTPALAFVADGPAITQDQRVLLDTWCRAGVLGYASPSRRWVDAGTGFFRFNEWLEALVYAAFCDAKAHDVQWRLKVTGTDTDFDVAATKGSVMTVCSCKSGDVKGSHLDELAMQARFVGGAFARKLVVRTEAVGWGSWTNGQAVRDARRAFDERARALGIETLYRESFPTLARKVGELLEGPTRQAT